MFKRISALVFLAALTPQVVSAETYLCQVDGRYTRGWFANQYELTVDRDAKTVMVVETRGDRSSQPVAARLTTDNARRLAGVFINEGARTTTGRRLRVRYTATIRKSDLQFSAMANVGNQGQIESAKGQCKQTS